MQPGVVVKLHDVISHDTQFRRITLRSAVSEMHRAESQEWASRDSNRQDNNRSGTAAEKQSDKYQCDIHQQAHRKSHGDQCRQSCRQRIDHSTIARGYSHHTGKHGKRDKKYAQKMLHNSLRLVSTSIRRSSSVKEAYPERRSLASRASGSDADTVPPAAP